MNYLIINKSSFNKFIYLFIVYFSFDIVLASINNYKQYMLCILTDLLSIRIYVNRHCPMQILTSWAALKQVVDVVPGIPHNLGPHQLTAHEPQTRGYPSYRKSFWTFQREKKIVCNRTESQRKLTIYKVIKQKV